MHKTVAALLVMFVARVHAQPVDATNRIIDQGLNHSQVMQLAQHLTDRIGGRLTNSPAMRQAETWTQDQFRKWGLKNVRKEGFPFGRGWSIVSSSVRMMTPRVLPLTAIPIAWTPATNGTQTAAIVVAPIGHERDLATWKGKLSGKIVLVELPDTGNEPTEVPFKRLTDADIAKLDQYEQPAIDPDRVERRIKRSALRPKVDAFLKAEGAIARVTMSYRDGKLVHGEGYTFAVGETALVPAIELAAEDYRRLARLAKTGPAPTLEINSNVVFDDKDRNAYNILADIPGTSGTREYVMAGAHLDSWVAGDGASDNAAGCVAVMEAARILATSGVRPKRTIRFALWTAEEQGAFGSMAYVEKYLATRPPGPKGETAMQKLFRWPTRFPIKPLPGHKDLAAYFNMDNGSGRVHGIYAEGNVAATPLLREWLSPFASMGAGNVVAAPTRGTDHMYLQAVGIPAYQFIQDPLDYDSRIHHTSADTFDHLKADDLRQASVVLAGVLLAAANSPRTLPRMPIPTAGTPTKPFDYVDPAEL